MLSEKINTAILMLQAFTAQKTADGELTDVELEQMIGELEAITAALQYEIECRQEARQAASEQGKQIRQEV